MGVAPATIPPPKAPPAKEGGKTPANKGANTTLKAGRKASGVPPPTTRVDPSPPAITPTTVAVGSVTDAIWAQVVSRGAKRAAAKAKKAEAEPPRPPPKSAKSANAPVAHAPNKKGSSGKAGGTARKGSTAARPQTSDKKQAPLPKLRSPSSAAITVTCADTYSYQHVVGKARSSMPIKGVRVSELDDSATPTEVAQELARACKRLLPEFKVGGVSRAPNGLGTCWVRCPVEAVKQLVAAPRIK
ncbi:PREDICTED: gap junction alpha-3 protein-like, partial [Acromyrmex echinatior]|uniref:gap junction alpha-3 protein-like n=1 Tax=Acromyrmex echinatior TaxID=103372 RepID=UPI000580B9F3